MGAGAHGEKSSVPVSARRSMFKHGPLPHYSRQAQRSKWTDVRVKETGIQQRD